jgi:hypothetical protein
MIFGQGKCEERKEQSGLFNWTRTPAEDENISVQLHGLNMIRQSFFREYQKSIHRKPPTSDSHGPLSANAMPIAAAPFARGLLILTLCWVKRK